MHLSSLFSLFAATVAVTMAQSQNQTSTGPQIFPRRRRDLSDVACHCDDGNCYMRGADEDCNLPVGNMVKCDDFYDMSD
ncbi:hypothetical protein PG991_007586 [Apiospora marii]|uniref:Uncharacterized protein n=1 Tax=Apiospora marii TaxID=335849 RepID=A0ABR1RV11_9PEZI